MTNPRLLSYDMGMAEIEVLEKFATDVVQTLQNQGHIAYFAGGCVRDRLMGRRPHDFDVATSARPEDVLALFPKSQKVGVAFGVVLVRGKGKPAERPEVEVATFRTDGEYHDGRHPEGVTFASPEEDAQRRDFTCNGLFYDPIYKNIHDFVGGQEDIASKTLRAIGHAEKRFSEDYLRMLRAVRFAAKLEFSIDSATFSAIQAYAMNIRGISRERVGEEMRMILEHVTRANAAELLKRVGLLAAIWPTPAELSHDAHFGWPILRGLSGRVSRATGLWAMHMDMGLVCNNAEIQLLRQAFALSNLEVEQMQYYAAALPKLRALETYIKPDWAAWKRIIASPHWPGLYNLWTAIGSPQKNKNRKAIVDQMLSEGVSPEPLIKGNDLIAMGVTPGPKFKQWLDALYDRQLNLELKTREDAMLAARDIIAQSNTGGA